MPAGVALKIWHHPESGLDFKTCPVCKERKPLWGFSKNKRVACGLCSYCKECNKKECKQYRKSNPIITSHKERIGWLRRTYNITLEEYQKIFDAQNGVCYICKQPETCRAKNGIKNLAVDHCHKTGKVRGLLCTNCNKTLGNVKDNIGLLQKMVAYLKEYTIE